MLNLKEQGNVMLGTSCPEDISDEIIVLAQRLSKIHGAAKIFSESGGVHIYIASPICLELYGSSELQTNKMHLAINADKYLGRAPYEEPNDFSALCMKTGEIYSVSDLLSFSGLESRGYSGAEHHVSIVEKKDYTDDEGDPLPPGDVVSVGSLEDDHPARVYIKSRGFDPERLVNHFNTQFCTKARSDVFFRGLGYGFSTSPRNRLIFNIIVDGKTKGWQSRIMEIETSGGDGEVYKFFYHTLLDRWFPVFKKVDGEWERLPGSEKWDPAKYVMGYGSRRSLYLMGYDASKNHDWIGLTEGPLDAARLGPPFCAVMGKSLSYEQADMCRNRSRVVLAIQNDEASVQFRASAMGKFRDLGLPVVTITPPPEFGDYGDMSQSWADEFMWGITQKYSLK